LNGTHQFLVRTHNVNLLGKSINAIKENTEALLNSIKEVVLEVNTKKTKYMIVLSPEYDS